MWHPLWYFKKKYLLLSDLALDRSRVIIDSYLALIHHQEIVEELTGLIITISENHAQIILLKLKMQVFNFAIYNSV